MRLISVLTLCALFLSGCKEPQGEPGAGLVTGSQEVKVLSVRTYTAAENSGLSSSLYYVVKVNFTNHLRYDFAPRINRFILVSQTNVKFTGADSGSASLVGISNYSGTLKRDESHEYTVGFQVPLNTIGTIFYDPT